MGHGEGGRAASSPAAGEGRAANPAAGEQAAGAVPARAQGSEMQQVAAARAGHPARSLASLLQLLDTLRRTAERQGVLTTAERRLLWLLSDGQKRTFRGVSEALSLEQSTVNRQVNGAVNAGLVRLIESHPARRVTVTERGRHDFNLDVVRILDGYQEAMVAMEPERAEELIDRLGEFVDSYRLVMRPDAGEA